MSQPLATERINLPRLLYIGDVPISNSVAGAALLYRLLSNYPAERLAICAPTPSFGACLSGVRYVSFDARWPRLFRTRLSPWYCALIARSHYGVPKWAGRLIEEARPKVIVTISQTCGWLLAWRLAQRERLPLVMLMHDDEVYYKHLPKSMWHWAIDSFGEAYRYAKARFCISPGMAQEYERRFGAKAEVHYPMRDPLNPVFRESAPQTAIAKKTLTFAYAGSVHGEPGIRLLHEFAARAGELGHKLIVYSPQHREIASIAPRHHAPVVRPPLTPSAALIERLREEADGLLLTGSFEAEDRQAVSMLFPSKMADYSAIGLPVLAWAPPQSSIAQFVNAHPGAALLVSQRAPSALDSAIVELQSSPARREAMAQSLLHVGSRLFDPAAARKIFEDVVEDIAAR